jgi:hypothetical protein
MKFATIFYFGTSAAIISGKGELCGGIAAIQCGPGLICETVGEVFPDKAGTCVVQTCGGVVGAQCPTGFTCQYAQGSSLGECQEISSPTLHGEGEICGGIAGFECAPGLSCEMIGTKPFPDQAGICVKIAIKSCNRSTKCPKGQKCLDKSGKIAVRGTCQKVECPALKCKDPCSNCSSGKCKSLKQTFADNGCKLCPVGTC